MAFVTVQQPTIREPKEKPDPLDRILKGLQIATSVFGIKSSLEQSELNELRQKQIEQDIAQGEASAKELEHATKLRRLSEQDILLPSEKREMKLYDVPSLGGLADLVGVDVKQGESAEDALKRQAPSLLSSIHRVNVIDPETNVVSVDRVIPTEKIDEYFKLKQTADAAKKERFEKEYKEKAEINKELLVPGYGLALTKQDAKELKEVIIAKNEVNRILKEMEDLRKEYGVEFFNRPAVERGQQLSKQLLLQYKNMAKLGVLSKSDEDIINAVIPKDPLGIKLTTGGDPVLSSLRKLQEDFNSKLDDNIKLRLDTGFDFRENNGIPESTMTSAPSFLPGVSTQQMIPATPSGARKRLQDLMRED
jgi:hypothetical protein